MKSVSVTVGMSADDMAIEACFERSMICDPDNKAREQGCPNKPMEALVSSDQRDDNMMMERDIVDHSNVPDSDATRELTDRSQPDLTGSHSTGSFIEAHFEMVLENWDLRWGQQGQASFQELADEKDGCANLNPNDDDDEEKVVVWSAEPDGHTNCRSIDSEIEAFRAGDTDSSALEQVNVPTDIRSIDSEIAAIRSDSTYSGACKQEDWQERPEETVLAGGNPTKTETQTNIQANESSMEANVEFTKEKTNESVEVITQGEDPSPFVSMGETTGLTMECQESTILPVMECQVNENILRKDDSLIFELTAEESSEIQPLDNMDGTSNSSPDQNTTLELSDMRFESIAVPSEESSWNNSTAGDVNQNSEILSQESADIRRSNNDENGAIASPNNEIISNLGMESMDDPIVQASTSPPTLSTLISQRKWGFLAQRLHEYSSMTPESLEDDITFFGEDGTGDNYLHEICKNKPTADVIRQWLQIKKEDVEKVGMAGHVPLHYACGFGASLEVVDILVDAFPEALTKPDEHDGMLPLHYACKEGAQSDVLDFLLMAYPEATLVQDRNKMTPMDYAMSLHDQVVRNQTIYSIQKGLKQNLSALSNFVAKSRAVMAEEQEKVKQLQQQLENREKKAEEDHSMLEDALGKVNQFLKSDKEKADEMENLRQKIEMLESKLKETQLLFAAEKKRVVLEKTKELESALKMEQCKSSALEQSLLAKQEILENEKERTKDSEQKLSEMRSLLENEKQTTKRLNETLSLEKENTKRLEEEQAMKMAEEMKKAHDKPRVQNNDPSLELEIQAETAQKLELERIRSEIEAKMEGNKGAIKALETSNAKKQEILEIQQEKVESLERVRREKETLLQKSQEVMKLLEESIERKLSLQKAEEDKIRQLDNLRKIKREMIESEEEQVRKLDYTLGRKQALLELEQMKEKTLQQTIARKNALLESEKSKMKELETICAEREKLLASEQNMVKALSASKKEREMLLCAERELVNDLYRVHIEKEALLEMKRKTHDAVIKRVKEGEIILEKERQLLEQMNKVREEKQQLLQVTDETLRDIEERESRKSHLLSKEQHITESLERFRRRRIEIASSGRLYSLVDTTLSISHLVKEAFLAKQHEQRLLEERKPMDSMITSKKSPPAPENFLRKAISSQGKRYISHFAAYLGISPTVRRKYLR